MVYELLRANDYKFFSWLAEVCAELDKPAEFGVELVEDESWYFCYDDGLTPQQAVKEFKGKHFTNE